MRVVGGEVGRKERRAATMAAGPFVRIPPRRGNIRVPAPSRRGALAGLALYGPCRPRILAAHHAAWLGVALVGPRLLPGQRVPWKPPMGEEAWAGLCEQWASDVQPFDSVSIYERPQASRSGCSVLLLRADRPVAFIKIRQDWAKLATSANVLETLARRPSRWFEVPAPMASGTTNGWSWLACTPMPPRPHRPPRRPPLLDIVNDVQERLANALDPTGVPDHWRPMHGDLTPWNLRRVGFRELWLVDWEEAAWGPPHADEVYYSVTAALLMDSHVGRVDSEEAVAFWRARVDSRPQADFDRLLNDTLAERLAAMGGRGRGPSA